MASNATTGELTLSQAVSILRRHEGSFTAIAKKLKVRTAAVSVVINGRSASKRIEAAVIKKALALLEQERAEQGTAA